MAGIISSALAKVKQEWKTLLGAEQVLAVCRAIGYRWRPRRFGPVETVQLFLLQILHGNTALTHLSHLWGSFVNASAFCETRYQVAVPGFRVQEVTLVSTLLDADEFPASELQKIYAWRWRIETNLRHLKTTMGLDVLKCQTVDGICKELVAFALIYNMVRVVMHAAAEHLHVPIDRISFVDALRWLASGGQVPVEEPRAQS
jgi:Transposase DDE domain